MNEKYNGRTNYETWAVSLRCDCKSDVLYIREWIDVAIEDNKEAFSSMGGLLGDLLSTNIDWEELENSFDD